MDPKPRHKTSKDYPPYNSASRRPNREVPIPGRCGDLSGRKNSEGYPCDNHPVKGTTTCRSHGGTAPQIKRGARERLNELAVPAVKGLRKAIRNKKDPSNRVKASIAVLDRTGFHPKQTIEVETKLIPFDKLSLKLREMIVEELDVLELEKGGGVVELLTEGDTE
jgi:hypothetical protein